jgi:hypothetical protein
MPFKKSNPRVFLFKQGPRKVQDLPQVEVMNKHSIMLVHCRAHCQAYSQNRCVKNEASFISKGNFLFISPTY